MRGFKVLTIAGAFALTALACGGDEAQAPAPSANSMVPSGAGTAGAGRTGGARPVIERVALTPPRLVPGQDVKAVVVLKADTSATAEELIEFCSGKLAGYKRPRSVDFIEALPKNPSGKVLKRKLREPYWKGVDRRVN